MAFYPILFHMAVWYQKPHCVLSSFAKCVLETDELSDYRILHCFLTDGAKTTCSTMSLPSLS
jgi:hypothetical protein